MKTKLFFALLIAALAALACQPSDPAFEPSLEVSGTAIEQATAAAAGETLTFAVKSNLAYTVSSDMDWATVSPAVVENADKKELTTTISVTVDPNTTEEGREAAIKISTDGYSLLDYTFTVKQSAAQYEKSLVVLNSDLTTISGAFDVEAADANVAVMVVSTVSWTATVAPGAEWLAVEPASVTVENYEETPTVVTLKIADNNTADAREATVTFAGEGVEDVVVTVKQEANIPFEATIKLMTVSEFNPGIISQYPEESSLCMILGYSSVPVVSGYYGLWDASIWDAEIADWDAYIESTISDVKQYGNPLSATVLGYINGPDQYYGGAFSNLESDKEYILIAIFEDEKGRMFIDYSVARTKKVSYDDYNGFLKIGNYNMVCIDSGGYTNSSTFTVSPSDTENQFFVKNLMLNNSGVWYATFDPEANTLSLSGLEVGYESDGNQFGLGNIYGWWNSESNYAYGYLSFNESMANEKGDAPIVFTVNSDGYISALQNYAAGIYVYVIDESFNITDQLGWGVIFLGESTNIAAASTAASANSMLSKKDAISMRTDLNGKRQMVDLALPARNFVELR